MAAPGGKMKPRGKNKDNTKRAKKKISILVQERVEYIDYKDVNLLRRFASDRAKIRSRRVTGNDQQQQRAIALAIKNAREMALLPYSSRVTTQRSSRSGERGGRGEGRGRRPEAETELTEVPEGTEVEATEAEGTESEEEGQ